MADDNYDIRDDELRIIRRPSDTDLTLNAGKRTEQQGRGEGKPKWPIALLLLILLGGIGVFSAHKLLNRHSDISDEGLFEEVPRVIPQKADVKPLGSATTASFTEKLDTVVNDVVLSIYIPHNSTAQLTLGVPDRNDKGIILAAQAADIRKDNRQILGSFVLVGEPLARGLSKKGFCAIIDGKVTVGVHENTPLFEEATEKDGYFFRQYPLVDNGVLVENEPKNKTMRKALCSRAGQIFMAVSETDESFHDFAQALVDLGVDNAIYLVGSHSSFGWYIDEAGEKTLFAPDVHRGTYKNENYIIWRQ